MNDEPDRPRRDVSIEEAERMPMTEGELTALEVTIRESFYVVYEELTEPLLALVAEVRRLREDTVPSNYGADIYGLSWPEAVEKLRSALVTAREVNARLVLVDDKTDWQGMTEGLTTALEEKNEECRRLENLIDENVKRVSYLEDELRQAMAFNRTKAQHVDWLEAEHGKAMSALRRERDQAREEIAWLRSTWTPPADDMLTVHAWTDAPDEVKVKQNFENRSDPPGPDDKAASAYERGWRAAEAAAREVGLDIGVKEPGDFDMSQMPVQYQLDSLRANDGALDRVLERTIERVRRLEEWCGSLNRYTVEHDQRHEERTGWVEHEERLMEKAFKADARLSERLDRLDAVIQGHAETLTEVRALMHGHVDAETVARRVLAGEPHGLPQAAPDPHGPCPARTTFKGGEDTGPWTVEQPFLPHEWEWRVGPPPPGRTDVVQGFRYQRCVHCKSRKP